MKLFDINNRFSVVCQAVKTRNGFRHEATLLCNGSDVLAAKQSYQNRTWERYPFETVLGNLADKWEGLDYPADKEAIQALRDLIKNN